MISWIKNLFGAAKATGEAVTKVEVAKKAVTEFDSIRPVGEKVKTMKKKSTRGRKPKSKA